MKGLLSIPCGVWPTGNRLPATRKVGTARTFCLLLVLLQLAACGGSSDDTGSDGTGSDDTASGGSTSGGSTSGGSASGGSARFGDLVWNDVDGDGVQDSGEGGFGGVSVQLLTCDGTVLDTTQSSASGAYSFENLAAGSYQLKFIPPGGAKLSPSEVGSWDTDSNPDPETGLTRCKTVGGEEIVDAFDAGIRSVSSARAPNDSLHAPAIIHFADDFDNGILEDSNISRKAWSIQEESNVKIAEVGGSLAIDVSGAGRGALYSQVNHEFDYFFQPILVSLFGLDLQESFLSAESDFVQLTLNSTSQPSWDSPDALVLRIESDGSLVLAWKTDQPGTDTEQANVLATEILIGMPTQIALTLDQTSYMVVLSMPSGDVRLQGSHDIPKPAWNRFAGSALGLESGRVGVTSGASTSRVTIDGIEVTSLQSFDAFANEDIRKSGFWNDYWRPFGNAAALSETNGALGIEGRTSGDTYTGVASAATSVFNFFAQDLRFSAGLEISDVNAAPTSIARFGLTSEASTFASASAIALEVSANGRVRLSAKTQSPNADVNGGTALVDVRLQTTPTSFDLILTKDEYDLTLHWIGGSQTFSGSHGIVWRKWSATGNGVVALEGEASSAAPAARILWDFIDVARVDPHYLAPTVFGPVGDGISLEQPPLDLAMQPDAEWGFIDVTKPPFNADPTGIADSTQALQRAITFARERYLVTFFPPGLYRVSDTLQCAQPLIRRTTMKILNDPEGPCVLTGSRAGANRPRIFLAPDSPGFGNPQKPKHVVHLWARNYYGDPETEQPNSSYNQMFVNIDIEIGQGNGGAIGIRSRGAQGTAIQDSTIDAVHGFAGIDAAAGSGGSHGGITVIGGQYGLYITESQPAPTITAATLIGQSRSAILYGGRQALSAVGIKITVPAGNTSPAIDVQAWGPQNGQISLIDSSIAFESPSSSNVAIRTERAVYLKNVYVENAGNIVEASDGSSLAGNTAGWSRVNEYANGITPPLLTLNGQDFQYLAPLYMDGIRQRATLVETDPSSGAPPADLQSQHIWPADFPSWESPEAVNVKRAPYFAAGDGVTDDTAALQAAIDANDIVFLPKGYYRISSPLLLRANTKFVGVSRTLTNILPARGASAFADPANPSPLARTVNNPNANTIVAFMDLRAQVDEPGVYSLAWRAGRNSIVRDVNFTRLSEHGYAYAPGLPAPLPSPNPPVIISGGGGGKWYNFYQHDWNYMKPAYRHLLVDGTTEPLAFYQFNAEHAQGEANAEVRGAQHVSFYGVKSESNYPVLWIRDSDHVSVYGYGGNGAAFEASQPYPAGFEQFIPSLFRIERTPNFRLVNLVDAPRIEGGHPVFGVGVDPNLWHMALENSPSNAQVLTRPLDRPVIYRRGQPD